MILKLNNPPSGNQAITQAEVQRLDVAAGTITFRWLDGAGNPADSGGSVATIATDHWPTEAELVAAIEASTA